MLLSSIPYSCKHTAAYNVRDVHSGASYLLLPPPTPPSSSSSPWDHLPLPTPLLLSPITQAPYRYAAASVVVTKSLGVSYLLSPPPTPPESSLSPQDNIPPLMPLSLSSIPRASQRDTANSVLVAAPSGASSLTLFCRRFHFCCQSLKTVLLYQRRQFEASL